MASWCELCWCLGILSMLHVPLQGAASSLFFFSSGGSVPKRTPSDVKIVVRLEVGMEPLC